MPKTYGGFFQFSSQFKFNVRFPSLYLCHWTGWPILKDPLRIILIGFHVLEAHKDATGSILDHSGRRGLDPLWYLEEHGQENSPTAFARVSRILQIRPFEDSSTLDALFCHLHSMPLYISPLCLPVSLAKVLFTSFLTLKLAATLAEGLSALL